MFFSFFKKNGWFILGIFILFLVVIINTFPKGYVFGGGDTNQFIEAKDNIKNLFYTWYGTTFFFYAIFFLLDLINIGNAIQLSFYLVLFIFGSYLSFFVFSKMIFPAIEQKKIMLGSLFYSLNLYTLYIFTGNWGYSYFPSLYIFLPLLVGTFIKFIKTQKNIYGVFFILVLFVGSSSFGNPAFLLSFIIFFLTLSLALIIFKYVQFTKALFLKIILLAIFSFLISSFWLFPIVIKMKEGVSSLGQSDIMEFNWWIRQTASPIKNTLSLNHFTGDHFPYNFYYKNFDYLKSLFVFLSFIPIIAIGFGFFLKRKIQSENHRFFCIFLFILTIFTLLAARLTAPFEVLNYYIYHLPGFITLRGFDKTAIYIPFLLSVLLLIAVSNIKSKKVLWTMFALILITPLPFFAGKIQQTAGYRVNSEKDYKSAAMSFLIKIPDEYYKIRKTINSDRNKNFIAVLPETYNDGSGIVYYPKWNFYGSDITKYLYEKIFIEANISYFKNWQFTSTFNESTEHSSWLPKLLGIMNSKYILYHKDAPEDSVLQSQYKMKVLEDEAFIKSIENNDYFTLYEIDPRLVLPYISYQIENFDWRNDPVWINRNAEKLIAASKVASIREINPKKFEVNFSNSDFSKNIVLAEVFNSNWKAYSIDKEGRETEIKNHFLARGYANGWRINDPENIEKIIIEYYPTRLMWRGIWISGITVLFLLSYLLGYYYKRKNNISSN